MSNTSVYSYSFDLMSRIGNDNIAVDQRNIQNINNANYNLENYYPVCKIINMRKDTSKFIQIYNILKNFFFQNLIEILKLTDEQKTEQRDDLNRRNNHCRDSIRRQIIEDLEEQIRYLNRTNNNTRESIRS